MEVSQTSFTKAEATTQWHCSLFCGFWYTTSIHTLCRKQKCCSVLQNYICHLFKTITPRWPNTVYSRRMCCGSKNKAE